MSLPALRLPGWTAALRIARREAWRGKGRSLLVIALIGVPIMMLTGADVAFRTWQLDPPDKVARWLGTADAAVRFQSAPVEQTPDAWHVVSFDSGGAQSVTAARIRAAVPGVTRIAATRQAQLEWQLRTPAGLQQTTVVSADLADPLVGAPYRFVAGHAARAPGQIAVTSRLAALIGARVGSTVQRETSGSAARSGYRVVGIVADPSSRSAVTAFVPAGSPIGRAGTTYYLRTSGPVRWPTVVALNARGWQVLSRAALLHPPPPSQWTQPPSPGSTTTYVGLIVIFGLALLEVVLLAGPAFAVSARRRERDLALVAAVGGTRRQLGRVVLADALVLGALGGALAVGLGVLAGRLGVWLLAGHVARVPGRFDVRPPELLALFGLALATAVAAALLPARLAARVDVVSALAGRRGRTRSSRVIAIAGAVAALVGVLVAVSAAATNAGAYRIVAGVVLLEAGLIAGTPILLGAVSRLAGPAPLTARMALRDTGRNRSSAASAVAAVMAAVVGAVALSVGLTTLVADRRAQYERQLAAGTGFVRLTNAHQPAPRVLAAVRDALPGASVRVLRGPSAPVAGVAGAPSTDVFARTGRGRLAAPADALPPVVVGTAAPGLPAGPLARTVAADLRAGRPVVFAQPSSPPSVPAGRLTRGITLRAVPLGHRPPARWAGPVSVVHARLPTPALVVPPRVARALRAPVVPLGVFVRLAHPLTAAEQQAVTAALFPLDRDLYLDVDPGYQDATGTLRHAFLAVGALLAVLAAVIATALMNVERRKDLLTLAAVGAQPGMRRRLAMTQALVIAGLGTVIGAGAGFLAPVAYVLAENRARGGGAGAPDPIRLTAPWPALGLLVVCVPVAAALIAGLLTRARLPAERGTGLALSAR